MSKKLKISLYCLECDGNISLLEKGENMTKIQKYFNDMAKIIGKRAELAV